MLGGISMFCHHCGSERSETLDVPCTNCNTTPVEYFSVGKWFLLYLPLLIPLVNIVLMLVWAISHKNETIRNYFIANWVIAAIVFVLNVFIQMIVFGLVFSLAMS